MHSHMFVHEYTFNMHQYQQKSAPLQSGSHFNRSQGSINHTFLHYKALHALLIDSTC